MEIHQPTDQLEIERQEALLQEMGINPHEAEKLRNTMLSPQEAVCAKQEELTRARQHKGRKTDWEEYVDAKRRMGRVMHHSEFIRRLRTIVPSLIVAQGGQRNRLGLYAVRSTPVKEVPTYKGPEKWNFPCPIYIGWIEMGYMPEYEIDIVNDVQIAIGQKRGWRTVLLNMIVRWNLKLNFLGEPEKDMWGRPIRLSRASFITEKQALEAFGPPSNGPTANNYLKQLYDFRNDIR